MREARDIIGHVLMYSNENTPDGLAGAILTALSSAGMVVAPVEDDLSLAQVQGQYEAALEAAGAWKAERDAAEARLKPLLAEAFRHGGCEETGDLGPVFTAADSWPEPDEYAERIIAALQPLASGGG